MSDLHSIRTPSKTPSTPLPTSREEAFGRSAVFIALASGFAPPKRESPHLLAGPEGAAALGAALAAAGLDALATAAAGFSALPPPGDTEERTFRRLFGHTARGSVPPYETEYGQDTLFQQPQRMADIAGFFAAFGLRLVLPEHERVDHIRCQLEFLAFLARKEAHALDTGDDAMLEEIHKAQRLFQRDHLGCFAPALGERLRREEGGGFYGVLGGLLRGFVEAECRRLGVAAGSENLVLRPADDEDDTPMMCGGGTECMPAGEGCPP